MTKKAFAVILLLFLLSPASRADAVLDLYSQLNGDTTPAALENFRNGISDFMHTQAFAVLSVQQGEMARLVAEMQCSESSARIDSLMIAYLAQSRAVLLKNQRYILFVTLLLAALIIIVCAAGFYVILVAEKTRIAKEILRELERERSRISFELHDTVAQEIAGASLILQSGKKTEEAQTLLGKAQEEIRGILSALNPPALEESPIENLLGELCASFQKASGVECSLSITGDFSRLICTAEEKLSVFRIVQEALSNVQKHAAASSVQVILRLNDAGKKGYVLFVCDDGCGFDAQKKHDKNHFGLKGIEQRVSILGGSLKMTSGAQDGTTVRVEVNK